MTEKEKPDVLLVHNFITPYRSPVMESINDVVDLTVYFCKTKFNERKWSTEINGYNFDAKLLNNVSVGRIILNHLLPIRLLRNEFDVYIVGESHWNVISTLVTLFFSKLYDKPLILWSESLESPNRTQFVRNPWKRRLIQLLDLAVERYRNVLYSQADEAIAYSTKTETYLQQMGVDDEKIHTGHQVMPEEKLPDVPSESSDTEFEDKTVVLSLGYLKPNKGNNLLIKTFKSLQADDAVLLIAGTGPEEEHLKTLADEDERIRFVGYVEGAEKAKYYDLSDIFVFPTYYDSWGLVVNEAMYYGLPVIMTDAPGSVELVRQTNSGIVFPKDDAKALRSALKELIEDDKYRASLARNADKSKRHYDISAGVQPFLDAIDVALSRSEGTDRQ